MASVSAVEKFRVLAIQADPPEIRPGQGTVHRVLYADPEGDGRPITFIWVTCLGLLEPSSAISAEACDMLGYHFGDAASGGDVYAVPPVPDDILAALKEAPEGEEAPSHVSATTVLSMCAGGTMNSEDLLRDFNDFSDLGLLCEGGDHILAFKTFRISEAEEENRNTNPQITSLTLEGKPLRPVQEQQAGEATTPGFFNCETMAECLEGADLAAGMTEGSFQTYEETRHGEREPYDEAPYISWFATAGELAHKHSRTATPPRPFKNRWSPPLEGGTVTLWLVAHDLRGGTSWKEYVIQSTTPMTN